MESNRVAEDSSMKAEEAEDAKSSDEEIPETLSGLVEQISWLGISSVLPVWLSSTRKIPDIALDVAVLTIL